MQPLNAIDAIAPAFTRTHQLFFARPRKLGRAWKLGACSYLAYIGSIFIPYPLFFLFIPRGTFPGAAMPAGLFAIFLIPMALYFGLFYCGVRMEFVEFEMIVTRARKVAPIWGRYGARTWRWLLLKVVIGTVLCGAMAPVGVRTFRTFFQQMQSLPQGPGAQADPAQFAMVLHSIMGFYVLFFGAFFMLKLFGSLLNDFVLPFYALEDVPLGEAFRRGGSILAAEPFHIAGYLLMKVMLAILGFIAMYVAMLVCMIPFVVVVVILAVAGAAISHAMPGGGGHLLTGAGTVILIGSLYVVMLALVIAAMGYVLNVLESYAVYFLGGRYPRLGDYLEPPTPNYTYTPPPVFPSPEESSDDSGDPPLPMDPALA